MYRLLASLTQQQQQQQPTANNNGTEQRNTTGDWIKDQHIEHNNQSSFNKIRVRTVH